MAVFRLSPTFFSFLAGGFVSVATNLFTGILLDTGTRNPSFLYFSSALMLLGAGCLLGISLRLERVHSKARGSDIDPHLRNSQRWLLTNLILAASSIAAGFVLLSSASL